jgi:transposase InsO family protein
MCWQKGWTQVLYRFERLMSQEGLRARPRRRGLPKDGRQRHAVSPNILDRSFVGSAPNQKWIADFTYIWTAQGWVYVAAVVALIEAVPYRIHTVLTDNGIEFTFPHRYADGPTARYITWGNRGSELRGSQP